MEKLVYTNASYAVWQLDADYFEIRHNGYVVHQMTTEDDARDDIKRRIDTALDCLLLAPR